MGLYTCVATSSSGETSWSAYLDVRGLSQGIHDSFAIQLADFHSVPLVFFVVFFFFLLHGQSQLTS